MNGLDMLLLALVGCAFALAVRRVYLNGRRGKGCGGCCEGCPGCGKGNKAC